MFATLRCNKDAVYIERAGSSIFHLACNNCRSKKLKCSGEQKGCRRCLSKNFECVYSEPLPSKGAKRLKITPPVSLPSTSISQPTCLSQTSQPSLATTQKSVTAGKNIEFDAEMDCRAFQRNLESSNTDSTCSNDKLLPSTPCFSEMLDETSDSWNSAAQFPSEEKSGFSLEHDILDYGEFNWDLQPFTSILETGDLESGLGSLGSDENVLSKIKNTSCAPDTACSIKFPPPRSTTPVALYSPEPSNNVGRVPAVNKEQDSNSEHHCERDGKPVPSSTITTTQSPCQCMSLALSLLETLEIERNRKNNGTVDHILRLMKRALAQCNALLDCHICTTRSNFMILLVVLSQKMTSSYEVVIRILREQYDKQKQPQYFDSGTMLLEKVADDFIADAIERQGKMRLRDYEIDWIEEACVFGGLTTLQLSVWRAFLHRLKTIVLGSGWDTHCLMLTVIEQRVQRLQSCGTHSLCHKMV